MQIKEKTYVKTISVFNYVFFCMSYEKKSPKEKRLEDNEVIKVYNERFYLMWATRGIFEQERKLCDDQFDATTYVDNNGNVQVNVPLEKSLIENAMWRQAGKTNFEIIPEGEADVQELQSSKYVLEHFLEDSTADYNRYNEKRKAELDCDKYGTSVMYTGLSQSKEIMYDLSDEATNFYDESYDRIERIKWCFIPRNVPLNNFWVDYSALRQSDFSKAKFCVMQETDTPENLKIKWEKVPWFKNLDKITAYMNIRPAYGKTNIRPDEAMVHYYFDKVTKDYWIIINRNVVVYTGKLLYRHGKLPFVMRQCFGTTSCLYGEGYCKRIRSMKAYKNTTLTAIIRRMEMTSGINIALFWNQATSWELYTAYDQMNIWKFAGNQDTVKQFELDGNIQSQANLLTILDDQIIQDSGQNLKAPYSSPANTATEIEVIEENKAIREKTMDELRDQAIQGILDQVFKNIRQFAPALLKKEIKQKRGKKEITVKIEYPLIKVPNVSINKKAKKGESIFVEDYGKFGFFELTPQTLKHEMTVKIVTPSTKSNLKTLEKNAVTQYIVNMNTLAWLGDAMAQEVIKRMQDWGIFDRINLAYWYDDKLTATTKKDDIKKKNLDKINQIESAFGIGDQGLWANMWGSSTPWAPAESQQPLPPTQPWANEWQSWQAAWNATGAISPTQ